MDAEGIGKGIVHFPSVLIGKVVSKILQNCKKKSATESNQKSFKHCSTN